MSKTTIMILLGYVLGAIISFGHAANHLDIESAGNRTYAASMACIVWPFYISYQLFKKEAK